jgi:hypothetical protein
MNIFDLTINNNNEKKVEDKSFASMKINHKSNKIDNLKNLFNIKGEEKYREDFISTQLYRHRKQRINFDNKFIYFKNYNLGNYLKNNINKRYNTICGLSQNSGDDFNLSKKNQKNKFDYLLLSNSGYNNKIMNSAIDRDINYKIDDNIFKINWQKTGNNNFFSNKNQLHLSSSQFQKENNILDSNTFKKIINYKKIDNNKKKLCASEKSFSNLELNSKCFSPNNQIEDLEKIKQSYNNLEKINNELNLLNKNLISENKQLKLQIINFSTNIYNNLSNEINESNEKSNIQILKNKIFTFFE